MLRIISGTAGGIRIKAPDTDKTRPTLERVKESVFGMLQPYIPGARVLDLFAGSGSLGLEALSRGAEKAVFVDESKICKAVILENIKKTRMEDRARVMVMDVYKAIASLAQMKESFDMVFMDPPYSRNFVNKTLQTLEKSGIIIENGLVAVEHFEDEQPPDNIGRLSKVRFRSYGDTCFSFYVISPKESVEGGEQA